jgi:hypothetical protein
MVGDERRRASFDVSFVNYRGDADERDDSGEFAKKSWKDSELRGHIDEFLGRDPRRMSVHTPPDLKIRTHRYRLGDSARLLAFERGVDYHMSEDLKQAGGNEPLEKPITFTAKLSEKAHVYDLRSGAYLGEREDITVDLSPWKPSLFALLSKKLPEEGRGVVATLLSQTAAAPH